jgi:PST family polysaccharide transporter
LKHVDVSDVGKKARSGAVWSALQIVGRNVLSIGSTAVLARLLLPDDYGLMGMVATLTALLLVFSDMGLSWATIQQRELTQPQVSNLFWINAGIGVLLWFGCALVAPMVAAFYHREELRAVTAVMGASFLLGGLAVQPFALMRRRMAFRPIALIEIAAVVAAALSAISLAWLGYGYWALVVQALVGQVVRLLLAWPASRLTVQAPSRGVGTRGMVAFGGLLAVNGVLIYIARNLDSVLIGRYWGAESLGYYTRAYFLMLLPSTIATSVLANLMVPSLSALQDQPERFGEAYRRAVRVVAFFGCPLALGLAMTAREAVQIVYGPEWLPVVPMLVWLSIAGITQPIYNTTGWLFTAKAKGGLYLKLTLMNASVLLVAFWIGVRSGPLGVAQAYGLVMGLLLLWPALALAHRAGGVELKDTLHAVRPVAICLLMLVIAVGLVWVMASCLGIDWRIVFGLKVLAGVLAYGLASRRWARQLLVDDVIPILPEALGSRLRWIL